MFVTTCQCLLLYRQCQTLFVRALNIVMLYRQRQCLLSSTDCQCRALPSMSMFVMLYRQCQVFVMLYRQMSMFVKLYRQGQCLLCSTVNVSVYYPLPSMSMFVCSTGMFVMLYQRQCLTLSMFVSISSTVNVNVCYALPSTSNIILYRHVNVC